MQSIEGLLNENTLSDKEVKNEDINEKKINNLNLKMVAMSE